MTGYPPCMARQRHAPARFPAPQVTLLVLGALFLVWGIIGFFFLGDPATDLAGRDTNHGLLGLETNALQNVIHVVLGLVALACTSNETSMRVGGVVLAVAGAALTVPLGVRVRLVAGPTSRLVIEEAAVAA